MEEQIGSLLQSAPHIVERILRHFSARNILRLARVCQLWRDYGRIVLRKRNRIVTMTATKQSLWGTQRGIIDNAKAKAFLLNLDIECGLAIVIQDLDLDFDVDHRPLGITDPAVADYKAMQSCLPPSFTAISVTCGDGVIGTSTDGACHERQSHLSKCFSAFLLPKLPREGTHVTHFSLSFAHSVQLVKTEPNKAALAEAFKWPKDQMIRCIVLVVVASGPEQVNEQLIGAIRTAYDGQAALAGALAYNVYSSAHQLGYVGQIFGGENVRGASVVIEEEAREGMEKRLKELKAAVDEWGECKQKIGFAFVSCRRGYSLYDFYSLKLEVFHQLMPDIPLNGMFTMNEFGSDYLPLAAARLVKKAKRSNDALFNYAAAFAVIGFI